MINVALILLELPDTRLVMQRRDAFAPTSPNQLSFFGGHMEGDETPDEAVRRELEEETSLRVIDLIIKPVFTITLAIPNHPSENKLRVYFYRAKIENDRFDVFEGTGNEAYTLADLLARTDLGETARYLLQQLQK